MKEWWYAREPRERLILAWGGVFVGLALLYALVWQPLQKRITLGQAALAEQRQTLQWMQRASVELKQLRGQRGPTQPTSSNQSLLGLLENSARGQGLRDRIARMEPGGNDQVQLTLHDVSFDQAIRWLVELHNRYGIEVSESTVAATKAPGEVNATFTLRR